MDRNVVEWLASGDTGISSETIAFWLSDKVRHKWAHPPADPSDLGRCLRLLDRCPQLADRFNEMAEIGGEWPTFVERWDEMAASMIEEVGIDWSKGQSAPKTYALMKNVEMLARHRAGTNARYVDLGGGVEVRT